MHKFLEISSMTPAQHRRSAIKKILLSSAALATTSAISQLEFSPHSSELHQLKGNIHHAVCQWTYSFLSLEELCALANTLGIKAIDLIGPKDWPILKKYGLDSSMCNGAEISLVTGWNDPQYHSQLVESYLTHIDLVADAGYKNLICFSGNRNGMDNETGLNNCANGLKEIISHAEKREVVIQMELFNSKVDHPDYMCDNSTWGIELCQRLGSENFKLLYDIYHMQISEGDIIRTIRDSHSYFGHYHTAGVPGRNEIDQSQELNYSAIMQAIIDTGYQGYVAQEFIPTGKSPEEKIKALKKAIEICDV